MNFTRKKNSLSPSSKLSKLIVFEKDSDGYYYIGYPDAAKSTKTTINIVSYGNEIFNVLGRNTF